MEVRGDIWHLGPKETKPNYVLQEKDFFMKQKVKDFFLHRKEVKWEFPLLTEKKTVLQIKYFCIILIRPGLVFGVNKIFGDSDNI